MPSKSNGGGTGSIALSYENDDISPSIKERLGEEYRTTPILHVNGSPVPTSLTSQIRPNQTLLDFLRNDAKLTGSKLGCGEGGCGACTVLVSRYSNSKRRRRGGRSDGEGGGRIVHATVNACLFPALAADGCHVTTIEGVGSWKWTKQGEGVATTTNATKGEDNLHPIQRAMVDMHGSQCGYCTPGIIMALYGLLLDDHDKGGGGDDGGGGPRVSHLEEHLDGNLCRCTGYRPIWDAARSLCVDGDMEDGVRVGPCGTPCGECPEREVCEMDCNVNDKCEEKKEGSQQSGVCEEKKCEEDEKEEGIVCSTSQSKVRDYKSILASKHSERWWDQPDDMFPKELLPGNNDDDGECTEMQKDLARPLMVQDTSIHNGGTWYQPNSLEGLLDLFREFGSGLKLVVGNTEVGIEAKFKHAIYPRLIHPDRSIHTLYEIFTTDDHLVVGGCSSLSELQRCCRDLMDATTDDESSRRQCNTVTSIHDMLRWFASTQIRNVACLGGNLVTASPISDMNPMLCALNATLVLASRPRSDGGIERRHVPVSDFFIGYRRVEKRDIEVIERVDVPLVSSKFEYVAPFKQARRREDDISIVSGGMRIKLAPKKEENCWMIEDMSIAFGGMAPKTVMAHKTMAALVGKLFEEATFTAARNVIQEEFQLPDDVPGGQSQYRVALACSFLYKFYLHCVGELGKDVADDDDAALPPVPTIPNGEMCGSGTGFVSAIKPSICGTQKYPQPKVAVGLEAKKLGVVDGPSSAGVVGRPATHASGPLHCTGEALYADDIPAPENTLHGSLILASQCHAKVVSVDTSPAMQIPGVEGAFTYEDIVKLGGDNHMGPIKTDEYCFVPVGGNVGFVGEPLGIVVGVSQEIAEKGARAVAVQYEELEGKAVVSIEDAIEVESFWNEDIHEMQRGGNVSKMLQQQDGDVVDGTKKEKLVVVEGTIRTGGQEHFYLEPNSALAIPSEGATNLTIYASTQAPTKTQNFVASVTNTPNAKVVVRMKRMGGGFGGKETRSVFSSIAAAVPAKLMNRPVRLTLNRDVDMSITGGRHAFLAKYRAGALVVDKGESKSVKLHALDVKLYSNGGAKFDLTGPVMDRALFHVDNCYLWPNLHSIGTPCRTSQPPHTAFRGFGGPQGMVVTEHIMDHLAVACDVSGDRLRRENMYTLNDATPFGMRFGGEFTGKWNVPTMWDRLYEELDIPGRRETAAQFNKANKWTKRGISFNPTKFGIAYTAAFMNQGGALVHLYTDGTVLVSHGGTEMGQGLHTKVCQVAAQAFGIPLDDVYVNDSSTDKVANTVPTAASMSTDMYGMATLDACRKILKRLQPIRDSLPPNATLKEVANEAFFQKVDLSAHGFFALDDDRCGYDWDSKEMPDDVAVNSNQPENAWRGHPFNYFTQGVALAEVEIDVLTGDHRVISADVLVDVGSSINPAIDIGQIEGAFVQGMGWCTMEEVTYADDDHTWIRPRAKVFTTGPGTYKIPAFNDVPETFNVSLLDKVDNPFAVHSSKAVGEPPFFLGSSVFFAIKDAVTAARRDNGNDGYFEFRMPATSERIRMACGDTISSECITSSSFQPKGSY